MSYSSRCHGCNGKGWVAPSYEVAVVCPICNGTGLSQTKTSSNITDCVFHQ